MFFLLILVNRAYCIIYYSCNFKEEGWAQLFVFLFVFFFTICKFFEVLKSTPNAGTQLVQQFFLQYQDLIYFLFCLFSRGIKTQYRATMFFYVIVNSRSLQINSIYVCVFSVQEVQQYVRANLSLLFLKGNFLIFCLE